MLQLAFNAKVTLHGYFFRDDGHCLRLNDDRTMNMCRDMTDRYGRVHHETQCHERPQTI